MQDQENNREAPIKNDISTIANSSLLKQFAEASTSSNTGFKFVLNNSESLLKKLNLWNMKNMKSMRSPV